jgi:signal transduction histidine kinase/ligand-binding sensor domain-containing protein
VLRLAVAGLRTVQLSLLLAGVLLLCSRAAWALDPALDVSQYAHTVWKIREGFTKGEITSIAQTPDGYLWLGTEFGLVRFDGVRAVPWEPPDGEQLPGNLIVSLLVTRDGTLWIGTWKGLASWKDGKITQYPELAGNGIGPLLEDRDGTVWAATSHIAFPGRLCAIQKGGVQCYGEESTFGRRVSGLYEDSRGDLWVGVKEGLWRWKPGSPRFYPLAGEPDGIRALGEDPDGVLLVEWKGAIWRLVEGKTEAYPLRGKVGQLQAKRILRDSDGGLWIGTQTQGLIHVHQGRTYVFATLNGLSGGNVYALFEDREHNIWAATNGGLDRFRNFAVTTLTVDQLNGIVTSVLADRDGSIWVGTNSGLNRWSKGQITTYGRRDGKLNGEPPNSLFQDGRGRVWVSTNKEFGYLEGSRFIPVRGIPGGPVHGIAEDKDGNLWIANQNNGLYRLSARDEVEQIPWTSLGRRGPAPALASDPSGGGLWLGFYEGGIVYFAGGKIQASYSAADGLGEGWVNRFRFDQDGTVWVATEGGLSRLKNGRVATLTSKNGLPCDAVHWVIRDDDRSFWLNMNCGLVRIARSEVDSWAAAADRDKNTKYTIRATVFDSSDGVRNLALPGGYRPQVTRSADGKLWFTGLDGVGVVDPRHLAFNKVPPLVHVEQITADRKTYWQNWYGDAASSPPKLPPLVRDLTIDYTALSLVVPEKVHFRYKLEGWDRDWQDVGTRRQAFYTNLGPRNYRFRVMACNNSGVWNEAGDTLDFSIAPAYYQTRWFRSLCVAAFLALLWALYQFRLHQLQQRFNAGLEARVNERTRIARELHDTLLQSFHGLLLRFQTVSNLLPAGEPKQKLDDAIDQAAQAITEGRDAVQGLRSSTTVTNDLAYAITTLGQELAVGESNPNAAEFHVEIEGTPRNLHPILRDEVYRIAGEALRNAFKHAQAKRIEVEIRYDERRLRLRVRDDGKGIDPKHLNEDGRPGHFGLRGMRERAKLMGGKLAVWSELDSGTEVELRIPSSRAYETSPVRRRSWLAEKFSGRDTEIKS